jgi:hypothetical protein
MSTTSRTSGAKAVQGPPYAPGEACPTSIARAKIYISVLPVWSSTLQGREGSISGYRFVKVVYSNGNRSPLLMDTAEISRLAVGGEA